MPITSPCGLFLALGGPSGVGKSTLIRALRRELPDVAFSVSATTRAPRPGEQEGEAYRFLSPETFQARVTAGDFLEHASVYGHQYGTLAQPTRALLDSHRVVLLDIDAEGSRQLRQTEPCAVHVMIIPPDLAALEARLRGRATESEASIQTRLRDGQKQLESLANYDYLIVNDDPYRASLSLIAIVRAELAKTARQLNVVTAWQHQLAKSLTDYT